MLVFSSTSFADGMIIPPEPTDPYPLILNHYVTVNIDDTYARVDVEQEFLNDGYMDIEGTYIFPVPEGGVRDFQLIVDGKVYEGKVEVSESEEEEEIVAEDIETITKIKVISDLPEYAEKAAALDVDGVGLVRLEFMIANGGKWPSQYIKEDKKEEYIKLLCDPCA